ncbi:hypothetical protein TNCV_1520321 [Trichonephila clavipes]|nr:hypothetical protein TNCV_1520321 [Trichonephila clavipes]
MSTKSHPKNVRTQAVIKKVKALSSDTKRKSADSKIHCIETRNVFRRCLQRQQDSSLRLDNASYELMTMTIRLPWRDGRADIQDQRSRLDPDRIQVQARFPWSRRRENRMNASGVVEASDA